MTWDQHVVSNFKPHYFAPWVQVCMHCSFCSGHRTLERLWSPSLDLRHAFLNEDCCMEAMFLIAASIPIAFGLPRLQLVCAGKRGLARCAGLPGRTFSVVALVLLELPMPQTLLEPSQLCLWWLSIFSECGFCQVTAQFLAEEGAKSICLLSRGGRAPTEAKSDSEFPIPGLKCYIVISFYLTPQTAFNGGAGTLGVAAGTRLLPTWLLRTKVDSSLSIRESVTQFESDSQNLWSWRPVPSMWWWSVVMFRRKWLLRPLLQISQSQVCHFGKLCCAVSSCFWPSISMYFHHLEVAKGHFFPACILSLSLGSYFA